MTNFFEMYDMCLNWHTLSKKIGIILGAQSYNMKITILKTTSCEKKKTASEDFEKSKLQWREKIKDYSDTGNFET